MLTLDKYSLEEIKMLCFKSAKVFHKNLFYNTAKQEPLTLYGVKDYGQARHVLLGYGGRTYWEYTDQLIVVTPLMDALYG